MVGKGLCFSVLLLTWLLLCNGACISVDACVFVHVCTYPGSACVDTAFVRVCVCMLICACGLMCLPALTAFLCALPESRVKVTE